MSVMAKAKPLIGVDVSSRTMSAVQLQQQGSGRTPLLSCALTIERVTQGAIPGLADLKRLAERLQIAGCNGADVIVGIPDEHALTAVLELPPSKGGVPIDLLALGEVARVHRREPSQLSCSRWTIPAPERSKPGTYTMAVATTHEVGEQLVDAFAASGLRVVGIDSRVCALGRCAGAASLLRDATSTQGLVGVVDLGYSRAQLAMLHMGGIATKDGCEHDAADRAVGPRIAYERAIEAGGLSRALSVMLARLGLDAEVAFALLRGSEAAADAKGIAELSRVTRAIVSEHCDSFLGEVQRSMQYAAQRYPSMPLRCVWMCGPGSQVRGIAERLEALVQVPVRQLTPSACFAVREGSVLGDDAQCVIASGLASGVWAPQVRVLQSDISKRSAGKREPSGLSQPSSPSASESQRSVA
jgi:Tfp pilus assembly PilM family ATPase